MERNSNALMMVLIKSPFHATQYLVRRSKTWEGWNCAGVIEKAVEESRNLFQLSAAVNVVLNNITK